MELDNPENMEDASYYTKSKLMFDISALYDDDGEDVRSTKLTNRSIHTLKKLFMREDAAALTKEQLMAVSKSDLSSQNDIWDLDYKSTSDEEDNDSSDEEDYGKVSYPKPRLHSEPATEKKKEEKKKKVKGFDKDDVIMKLI